MKFFSQRDRPNIAISDCRLYRIETTTGNFTWYNAYYDETKKHVIQTGKCIGASDDKDRVKRDCDTHAEQQAREAVPRGSNVDARAA